MLRLLTVISLFFALVHGHEGHDHSKDHDDDNEPLAPSGPPVPFGNSSLCPLFSKRNLLFTPKSVIPNVNVLDNFFQSNKMAEQHAEYWNCTQMEKLSFVPRYERTMLCRAFTQNGTDMGTCEATVEALGSSVKAFFEKNGCQLKDFDKQLDQYKKSLKPSTDPDCINGEENEPNSCGTFSLV
jgi:hypothetical protein